MPKYTASIFIIAAVLCCSSLAYPFRDSSEFFPTDEGKLRRDEVKERESHEERHGAFWNDEATLRRYEKKEHTQNNKASSLERSKREDVEQIPEDSSAEYTTRDLKVYEEDKKLAKDIVDRLIVLELTVSTVKESLREQLRNTLTYAARRDWKNIEDFMLFCANEKVKAEFRSVGIDLDKEKYKSDSESDEIGLF